MQNGGTKCKIEARNAKWWHEMQNGGTKCKIVARNAKWWHKMQNSGTKCKMVARIALDRLLFTHAEFCKYFVY